MSRYLTICAIWLGVFFGTSMAGDWYYGAFSLYQCAASLIILYFVIPIRKSEAWANWLGCFCLVQIVFHTGDYLLDYSPTHYNHMLDVLNTCEAIILFGLGGLSSLYRWMTHGGSDRDGSNLSARVAPPQPRRVSRRADGV